MKKLLSAFLIFILIISAFSTSCFAANPVELRLDSETDTVYASDEFVVKLMISDNSKMSGAAIDINYDKNKFEYVSGTFGGILDSSATMSLKNIDEDKSKVRFTYLAPSSMVTSQGILVTLKFKALENAYGDSELTISIPNPGDFVSQNLSKLTYTVENSKISIKNDNIAESESVAETGTDTETESQIVDGTNEFESTDATDISSIESTSEFETTTAVAGSAVKSDDDNTSKKILSIIISGVAILLVVVLLGRKSKNKRKK